MIPGSLPRVSGTTAAIVAGPSFTVIRPNNVVAYALGQVYGETPDARISVVTPALPADALLPGYSAMQLNIIQRREPGAAAFTLAGFLFLGALATVLGDQQAFSLSDGDIAQKVLGTGQNMTFPTGFGTHTYNQGAGAAGRRWAGGTLSSFRPGATAQAAMAAAGLLPPATALTLYLVAMGAFTPLANEQLDVLTAFQYINRA